MTGGPTSGPAATDAGSSGASAGGSTDGGGDGTTGAGTTPTPTTGDATGGTSGDVKFDLPGGGGPVGPGCEKIDFLFVIDNSGSMTVKQENLVASFPGFVDAIAQNVSGQDHHIMVVTTDGDLGNDCETRAGSGRTWSGKTLLANPTPCTIQGDARWLPDDQPSLQSTFACIATVGVYGDPEEHPMEGLVEALSDGLQQPGGCNDGFLRDDAVLVVTIVTDTEDGVQTPPSPGDPPDWIDAVLTAKNGDPGAMVVLGVIGDNELPNALCTPGGGNDPAKHAEAAPRLVEFLDGFGVQGLRGSVCAPDYAPFFQQAVQLIDTTCDAFEPPG